jgi:hypothetical protein
LKKFGVWGSLAKSGAVAEAKIHPTFLDFARLPGCPNVCSTSRMCAIAKRTTPPNDPLNAARISQTVVGLFVSGIIFACGGKIVLRNTSNCFEILFKKL